MSNRLIKHIVVGAASAGLLSIIVNSDAKDGITYIPSTAKEIILPQIPVDTPEVDLPYPYSDQSIGDPLNYPNGGGLMLSEPSNINNSVEYDPETGDYIIKQSMGGLDYRPSAYMDRENYEEYMFKKQVKSYWKQKVNAESQNTQNNAIIPKLNVGGEIFDRIFGGNTVDIRPNGSAELIFGYNGTRTENPALPVRQRRIRTFDYNMKIQLNVVGKIGDKLKLTTSYNTEATFDFENQMKLEYTGYDDEIIKKIEAGNVSLPLNGSLITGSQTLFGVKTQLQFGRLTVTSILSQQKGKKSEVEVTGGAQINKFEVAGDMYEQNKHFFLGHYFRDNFNTSLAGLPFVNSAVNVTRIEVWVTNINNATTDVRDVVGFAEIAEDAANIPLDQQPYVSDLIPANALPDNAQNNLYQNMVALPGVRDITTAVTTIKSNNLPLQQAINYEAFNARKLQPSEYTFNARLGFISLNQQLNPDQILAVAYQYTANGQTYNVGEFSDGGISAPQALYLKLLKSTTPVPAYVSSISNTKVPSKLWDLMMKNIYSIGSYQINSKDFKLDIIYTNAQTGTDINYLPVSNAETTIHGRPMIQVLNLDRLNQQNDQTPDGLFDFIDGVTINAYNGRVIFPMIEPFGKDLRDKFTPSSTEANIYVFEQLYDSTRTAAQQFPNLNRYKIKGQFQSSSSSEISLGAPNVPQGSVVVTAGGVQLTENVDYTVDYTLGRVKIINEGILNSGMPIKISLESNALFAIQQKRLFGTHLDYRINKDFSVGATLLNLTERPLTQKVNIGDEPISNTIWGLDANYRTDAPFLTRWIDKIPLIDTKEMSTITAAGEFAYLVPGHAKAIGKNGNSYIDDFEGSQSTIDLRAQGSWRIASTPQGQTSANMFPEGALINNIGYGFNRAKINWYVIDPLFLRQTNNLTPSYYTNADMSNHFAREIPEQEIFPNKPYANGQVTNIPTLDMAYYPDERGPYNYDTTATGFSAGLDANGKLNNPASRWGGIQRAITTNDFEAANIEFIQFWMMDPFNSDNPSANWNSTGDLYFNLGNISEDVLSDSYRSSENGLPAPSTQSQNNGNNVPTTNTVWGVVPTVQPLVNAFNSDEGDRPFQDVGLDGLSNTTEQSFFNKYLSKVQTIVSPTAYSEIAADPSADDFHYFRGTDFDNKQLKTLERYKQFNGLENNSRSTQQSPESYPTSGTTLPDGEDINRDNNLSTNESYFQYHISLKPADLAAGVGTNYITNVYQTVGQNIKDGTTKPITWYQFRIPVKTYEQKIGPIEDFRSIRFIRMFFKNVDKPIILRFARLEFVRGEWRKYGYDILQPGLYIPNDDATTQFDIAAVNIEEHGAKSPVNYVLPPGIQREINAATANLIQLNEQAMALTVCNLEDGKARAAFKNTELDVRSYKKLKMFVHAEASTDATKLLSNGDLHLFVRLGTDYTDNYYEYEIPLIVTPPGNYNGTDEQQQYIVWPEANEMILEFSKLQSAKQKRNIAMLNGGNVTLTSEFTDYDGTRKIVVKGNPNLSAIKTIMIGIINPKKTGPLDDDDGLPKCGTVWVNELRLTDFDEKGGWAANARVTAKLADFGTMSVSGNMYTPGFGSIENKVSERKRETLKQYDFSTSLELGKFIPEKHNVHIPMFVGYSETFITPQFNPLDPDILLQPTFSDQTIPKDHRDSIKKVTQDYTRRKSINFTNVKKDKGANSKKSHIYDIENIAVSYSFSEMYKRSVNIEYNLLQSHRGGLQYNYAPRPKNIQPFAKVKLFQKKYFLLIKDINFFPYPNKLGFATDVQREYNAAKNRNTTGGDLIILPTYNKIFNMNRNYTLNYDITKGLKLDFTATNQARILEPQGQIDTEEKKDSLRDSFLGLGKTIQYNHQTNLNYTIPINKIPLLDFTTASVRYSGTYSWQRAPFNADSLGNTIQNSQNISWNGQMNMTTLYNKIPFFKKINQGKKSNDKNNSKGKNASALSKDKKSTGKDSTKKENPYEIVEHIGRFIMGIKNISFTYSTNSGTLLPGYAQSTNMMGMDQNFAGPTPGFIFGFQNDIRPQAERENWLVKTQSLNTQYTTTWTENMNIRSNVEPIKNLKIELTANRTQSKNQNEFYRWNRDSLRFLHESPMETGNYSMSFMSYKTSFKDGATNFKSFLDARANISQRLGADHPISSSSPLIDGYAQGYNETSPNVLIPAFLAAYSGANSGSSSLNIFPAIPKPNWRATYDGLTKIEAIKKYFKSFTLSHAYRSTYSVGGFTSNLLYSEDDSGNPTALEDVSSILNNPNFISKYQINTVTISEQWSPFIKLDMTLNNSLLISFEYKKDRNLSLGLTSKTVAEVVGNEIIAGTGYRLRDISFKNLKIQGKPLKSDVNLKVDVSYRKNVTTMHRIVEVVSQTTGGTDIISIKCSADYVISNRINVRFFYDRIINKPVISNSFKTVNTNAGLSLRITLSN